MTSDNIVDYKNTLEIIKNIDTEVNVDLVWNLCQQNKNRLSKFFGYLQINSLVASKDTIEFLEEETKSQNKRAI